MQVNIKKSFLILTFLYVFIVYSNSLSKFGEYNIGIFGLIDLYGKYSIYVLTIIFLCALLYNLKSYNGMLKWIIFLWTMIIVSLIVSINPFGTLVFYCNLLVLIFWAYWASIKFVAKDFIGILVLAGAFILFLQFYFMYFYPQHAYGLYLEGRIFVGTFYQKNNTAIFLAFVVISSSSSLLINKNRLMIFLNIINIVGSIFLMIHIGSATSLIACFSSLFFTLLIIKSKIKVNLVLIGLGVNIIFIALLYGGSNFLGNLLEDLGRDSTLTGRTLIWESLFKIISENALFGYGYDTFWIYNLYLRSQITIDVGGAHNGLIELLLNFGIVGTIWFLILWIDYGRQLKSLLVKKTPLIIFPCAYTLLLLIYIISERTFNNSSYQTLIFVWCLLIVSKNYYTKEQKIDS